MQHAFVTAPRDSAPRKPAHAALLPPGLPAECGRRGNQLLNQQFWLFGQDIKRPVGNLLLERGFAKQRPPEGEQGSSSYTLIDESGAALVFWGFGLFFGEPATGGVYLSRFKLAPNFSEDGAAPRNVWLPQQIDCKRLARESREWLPACRLLAGALRRVSEYERWVQRTAGPDYRRIALESWPRPACSASDTASQWLRLANRLDDTLLRGGRPGPA